MSQQDINSTRDTNSINNNNGNFEPKFSSNPLPFTIIDEIQKARTKDGYSIGSKDVQTFSMFTVPFEYKTFTYSFLAFSAISVPLPLMQMHNRYFLQYANLNMAQFRTYWGKCFALLIPLFMASNAIAMNPDDEMARRLEYGAGLFAAAFSTGNAARLWVQPKYRLNAVPIMAVAYFSTLIFEDGWIWKGWNPQAKESENNSAPEVKNEDS